LEAITRLVADSLARHGFDRPVDPSRLQWSRWFRCESTHSLLVVPSKPGIFALAEEVMDLGLSGVAAEGDPVRSAGEESPLRSLSFSPEGAAFISPGRKSGVGTHQGTESRRDGTNSDAAISRRMLAVLQFSEDDDMAFTLDRMFTCVNPMRVRLTSGRCFLRFVVIQDQAQRRSICNALNQWMLSSAEKATGITTDFQSLESSSVGASVGRAPSPATAEITATAAQGFRPEANVQQAARDLDSGANKNRHCPHPLPSGF
jgi:hypothetical protein